MDAKVIIVGCGPGAVEYMTDRGNKAIAEAEVVAGSPHLLKLHASEGQAQIPVASDIEGALDAIEAQCRGGRRVAVLVSGDPGLCSFAAPVLRRFGLKACEVIPGISSVQFAFARLGLDWLEAKILSAHKALPDVQADDLKKAKTLVILCGHHISHQWVIDLFATLGQGRKLTVCQDLSLATERIESVDLETFKKMELSSRTIVVIT